MFLETGFSKFALIQYLKNGVDDATCVNHNSPKRVLADKKNRMYENKQTDIDFSLDFKCKG